MVDFHSRTTEGMRKEQAIWLDFLTGAASTVSSLPMLSGSMAPYLSPGDLLQVVPIDSAKAHIGDIIVFRESRKLVAHRLIFAFRVFSFALYIEKGDANPMPTMILPGQIVGRVELARREGKLVLERSREYREEGRRIAARALLRYLIFDAAPYFLKKAIRRHA
jgi:signal peptidase I